MPWVLSPLPEPELAPPPAIRVAEETVIPTLADVRCYIDQGDLENAVRCCELLLEKENLNPSFHLYHALVLKQMPREAEAERSLRRAIYLDRRFVLAHYYLGVLLQSTGDPRQAARCFENTVELLGSRLDDEVLAEADGITVAELKKLAKMQTEILSEKV